jgi:cytosine/adenosine deaminase-related metal-dependent hydrolase
VRLLDPAMPASALLHAMTLGGAVALALEGVIGEVSPRAQADLIAVRASVDAGGDPAEAFLAAGSRGVERVMTGGAWRMVDCAPTEDVNEIESAAAATRAHVVDLLGA